MFPLHLKYNIPLAPKRKRRKTVEGILDAPEYDNPSGRSPAEIEKIIIKELQAMDLEGFEKKGDRTVFKNRFFNGQDKWHPLAIVDAGHFEINTWKQKVTFSFSTKRATLIILLISSALGIIAHFVIGIENPSALQISAWAFGWGYGANITISYITLHFLVNGKLRNKILSKKTLKT